MLTLDSGKSHASDGRLRIWTALTRRAVYAWRMLKLNRPIAAAVAALLLGGCGVATPIPDTQAMRPAGNGVDTKVGSLLVQDTVIVLGESGVASLSATVLNTGAADDAVVQVAIAGAAAVLTPAELTVSPEAPLRFGYRSSVYADLPAAASTLVAGTTAEVTYTFAAAGTVTVHALVVEATGMYAEVSPAPQPTAADAIAPVVEG